MRPRESHEVGLFTPLISPTADRNYLATLGRTSDERGFHSLWFGEHVVVFDQSRSRYPWSSDGRMPAVHGTRGLPELFTTLAFPAAHTERIRLGSGTCVLPVRNPVITAKEAAKVDWLSGGRFDLGVGLGWLEEEFEALGVPWQGRGRHRRSHRLIVRCHPLLPGSDPHGSGELSGPTPRIIISTRSDRRPCS